MDNWNVSNVSHMDYMFYYAKSFNHDINKWDVSNVKDLFNKKNMCWMFMGANSLTNLPEWYNN